MEGHLQSAALRSGAGKRPASPTHTFLDIREQKRPKECQVDSTSFASVGAALATKASRGAKRSYVEDDCVIVDDFSSAATRVAGTRFGVTAPCGAARVLRASDLENSIASISGALRWRSPVKPHKLPRLHGGPAFPPPLRTAVRGIVDVGADADDDDLLPGTSAAAAGCHPQPQPHQQQQGGAAAAATGSGRQEEGHQRREGDDAGERGQQGALNENGAPPTFFQPQPCQQQQEWGQLFSLLSLGGAARGSQRTDPVWAAASSNRMGSAGAAGGSRRSTTALLGADHPQPPQPPQLPQQSQPLGSGSGAVAAAAPAQAPSGAPRPGGLASCHSACAVVAASAGAGPCATASRCGGPQAAPAGLHAAQQSQGRSNGSGTLVQVTGVGASVGSSCWFLEVSATARDRDLFSPEKKGFAAPGSSAAADGMDTAMSMDVRSEGAGAIGSGDAAAPTPVRPSSSAAAAAAPRRGGFLAQEASRLRFGIEYRG